MTPSSATKFSVPYISLDGVYLASEAPKTPTENKYFSTTEPLEETPKFMTPPKEKTYVEVKMDKSTGDYVYVIKNGKPVIFSHSVYLNSDKAYNEVVDIKKGMKVPSRDKDGHILLEVNSVSSKSSDSGYSSDCCEAFCCCLEISLRLVTCFCEIADACNK